jgi:hypothetical protein
MFHKGLGVWIVSSRSSAQTIPKKLKKKKDWSMDEFPTISRNGYVNMSGWWLTHHLEKYESQWEGLSHILWEKNV